MLSNGYKKTFTLIVLFSALSGISGTFPEFSSLDKTERFPQDVSLELKDGTITVDGTPRFIIGTIIHEGADLDAGVSSTGYTAGDAWFYEALPDYSDAQRLGIDSFGIVPPRSWRKRFRPRALPRRNMAAIKRIVDSGLPLIGELAIEDYSHARFEIMDGVIPSVRCWYNGVEHGIPYSIITAEGVEFWKNIWKTDTTFYNSVEAEPFVYRIFADADYYDESAHAGRVFNSYLVAKYRNVDEMNKAFGTKFRTFTQFRQQAHSTNNVLAHVEYIKFLETKFAEACATAVETIRDSGSNTNAAVCFQARHLNNNGIDLYEAAKNMQFLYAPNENVNPLLCSKYMTAIAEGKPVFAPDANLAGSASKIRNSILSQFAHGYAIVMLSEWRRGARSWIRYTKNAAGSTVLDKNETENAGKLYAQKHPYHFMNPYAVPTEAITGIRTAKKDILEAGALFSLVNFKRNTKIALLHSRPSERLSRTSKAIETDYTSSLPGVIDSLTFSHIKNSIILEEQLGTTATNELDIIVATESSYATYSETPEKLEDFASAGGTVFIFKHALALDEYGNASSNIFTSAAGWTDADIDGIKASRLDIGKGKAIRFEEDINNFAAVLLSGNYTTPSCQCIDSATGNRAELVEITVAESEDGQIGLILFNRKSNPVSVKISIPRHSSSAALNVVTDENLPRDGDFFMIELKPDVGEIVKLFPQ